MASAGNRFDALKGDDDNGQNGSSGDYPTAVEQIKKKPPGPVPESENELEFAYSFWFSRRLPGMTPSNYEATIKLLGTFNSVEQFGRLYLHLKLPLQLPSHSDYHIFKYGIKPMWEDDANKHGGKWIVRLRKGLSSRAWENVILAMIGEQFMVGAEICGAVISVRGHEDILSVWNRTASDHQVTNRIQAVLRRILNLPSNTKMEYKTHNDSLRDNSSFRNTDVYVR